jgi:uncharacterized protein YciI
MRFYILNYERGPNWIEGGKLDRQHLHGHLRHLAGFYSNGILVMGGPFRDTAGGLVVVQTGSREEAEAIGATDPGVRSGVLRVTVHEWRPIDWARFATEGVEFAQSAATVRFASESAPQPSSDE